MSGHLCLAVLAALAAWLAPQVSDATSRAARLAAWREALELDLAREVLTDGLRETAPDGALARDGLAISLVAKALVRTGELERARELVSRAEVDAGSQAELDLARVRLALEDDALDRALDLVLSGPRTSETPISVRYPEIAASYLLAGRALARAGDLEHAAPMCARFVELAPHDFEAPAAWHMLAQAAIAKRDLDNARRFKHNAEASAQWQAYFKTRRLQVRAHPSDPLPHVGIAELWLSVGEHARASDCLREILVRWPKFCRALHLLGETERRRSEIAPVDEKPRARAAAYAWFTRALDCDPGLPEAHFDLGLLAWADGDRARALPQLEWIAVSRFEAEPRFLATHLVLARILRDTDAAAADAHLARYRALGGHENP